jgi:hypothetical protein
MVLDGLIWHVPSRKIMGRVVIVEKDAGRGIVHVVVFIGRTSIMTKRTLRGSQYSGTGNFGSMSWSTRIWWSFPEPWYSLPLSNSRKSQSWRNRNHVSMLVDRGRTFG